MAAKLELDLLDNALDYVLSAAQHATAAEPRSWKYAVLHLFGGIELLLKDRLKREHWSLLFAEVNKASDAALRSGDFKSVDFETCCDRLTNIAKVKLDKADQKRLNELRKIRNTIQHFEATLTEVEVKSQLAFGLSFVIGFCERHFDERDLPTAIMEDIHEHLSAFKEYLDERYKAIVPFLDAAKRYFECPRCGRETVDIGDGEPKCVLCKSSLTAEGLASFLDGWSSPGDPTGIEWCPSCGNETCVRDDDGDWVCTSCGEGGEYEHCLRCGQLFEPDDEEQSVCNDCYHEAVNSDD